MKRQSVSLTKPNDEWLKEQLKLEEYGSKSELINDLIRKEREKKRHLEWLEAQLVKGELSGHTSMDRDEILAQSKEELRKNGKL